MRWTPAKSKIRDVVLGAMGTTDSAALDDLAIVNEPTKIEIYQVDESPFPTRMTYDKATQKLIQHKQDGFVSHPIQDPDGGSTSGRR